MGHLQKVKESRNRHLSEGILKESGVQAAIMKPFTNQDLCLAVRNAIDAKT
jgi:hypothetical protein